LFFFWENAFSKICAFLEENWGEIVYATASVKEYRFSIGQENPLEKRPFPRKDGKDGGT